MMVSHGEMSPQQRSRDLEVVLPNGVSKKIQVLSLCTVNELKVICEASFGIPTELQKISLVNDDGESELKGCVMVPKAPLKLQVPIWWAKFICCVLKNEVENVFRRVQLPMQQVSKDERIFVALFMGACCGLDDLVARMAKLKTKVNLSTATDTGRTLYHACAASGSSKCLDILIKHLMTSNLDSLENVDVNKENAYQLAERLRHRDVAERLLRYMNKKIIPEETCRASGQSVEAVSEATRSSYSPHQRQANKDRKINSEAISNERVVEKNKQNEQSDAKEDINSDDNKNHERTSLVSTKYQETLKSNEGSECVLSEKQEEARKISDMPVNGLSSPPGYDTTQLDSDRPIKPTSPTSGSQAHHLLTKRRGNEQNIYNTSTTVPGISIGNESSEDELEQKTRLPSLGPRTSMTGYPVDGGEKVFQVQHRPGRKLVIRSISTPNSPDMSPVVSPRNSPTSEVSPVLADMITDTRSAPNSPLARRSLKKTFKAVGMTARFAVGNYANPPNSPVSRARISREPLALATPNVGNAGIKFDRFRRGSLAVGNDAVKIPIHRGKSR